MNQLCELEFSVKNRPKNKRRNPATEQQRNLETVHNSKNIKRSFNASTSPNQYVPSNTITFEQASKQYPQKMAYQSPSISVDPHKRFVQNPVTVSVPSNTVTFEQAATRVPKNPITGTFRKATYQSPSISVDSHKRFVSNPVTATVPQNTITFEAASSQYPRNPATTSAISQESSKAVSKPKVTYQKPSVNVQPRGFNTGNVKYVTTPTTVAIQNPVTTSSVPIKSGNGFVSSSSATATAPQQTIVTEKTPRNPKTEAVAETSAKQKTSKTISERASQVKDKTKNAWSRFTGWISGKGGKKEEVPPTTPSETAPKTVAPKTETTPPRNPKTEAAPKNPKTQAPKTSTPPTSTGKKTTKEVSEKAGQVKNGVKDIWSKFTGWLRRNPKTAGAIGTSVAGAGAGIGEGVHKYMKNKTAVRNKRIAAGLALGGLALGGLGLMSHNNNSNNNSEEDNNNQ